MAADKIRKNVILSRLAIKRGKHLAKKYRRASFSNFLENLIHQEFELGTKRNGAMIVSGDVVP